MNLTTATILHGVARTLGEEIGPQLRDAFAIDQVRLAATLVTLAAHAFDDAAALRVEENARIRALFAQTHDTVGGELGERLAAAAASTDPGLRISQLDAENGRLRALLVELHAAVDAQTGVPARAASARIWQLLRDMEAVHAPRA